MEPSTKYHQTQHLLPPGSQALPWAADPSFLSSPVLFPPPSLLQHELRLRQGQETHSVLNLGTLLEPYAAGSPFPGFKQ